MYLEDVGLYALCKDLKIINNTISDSITKFNDVACYIE